MFVKTFPVGALGCNCSILGCEKTLEAIIIDPGDEAQKILNLITQQGFKVKAILHTHTHVDHISATKEVKDATNGQVMMHEKEKWLYENFQKQLDFTRERWFQDFWPNFKEISPVDHYFEDEEIITFGDHKLNIIFTPGHTEGSSCFQVEGDENLIFTGDTLFQSSVGRTDLWGISMEVLVGSIKNRLLTLDDDSIVIPGHGPNTKIGLEKRMNPFLV
ncbi:MAG: MBL fold metallo-hydrolase [Calditrichaeota bacterium]|nr:MAG: MBL fold metallo-hydrolase [Calditrichota bacterium]